MSRLEIYKLKYNNYSAYRDGELLGVGKHADTISHLKIPPRTHGGKWATIDKVDLFEEYTKGTPAFEIHMKTGIDRNTIMIYRWKWKKGDW